MISALFDPLQLRQFQSAHWLLAIFIYLYLFLRQCSKQSHQASFPRNFPRFPYHFTRYISWTKEKDGGTPDSSSFHYSSIFLFFLSFFLKIEAWKMNFCIRRTIRSLEFWFYVFSFPRETYSFSCHLVCRALLPFKISNCRTFDVPDFYDL